MRYHKFYKLIIPVLFVTSCSLGGDLSKLGSQDEHPQLITGKPIVGENLEADISSFGGTGIVKYQWKRGGINIDTAPAYTIKFADVGSIITVTITGTGITGSVTSAPVGPVPMPLVGISGNVDFNRKLSANITNLGGNIIFKWIRNGTDIIGTDKIYEVQAGDTDSEISIIVSIQGDAGSVTGIPVKIPILSSMGISLTKISAGTFMMGSPLNEIGRWDDEVPHQVALSRDFYMGIDPITQDQYKAVMGENLSSFKTGAAAGEVQGRRPAETLSWFDAIVFCNVLSVKENLSPVYEIQESSDDPLSWTTDTAKWGKVPDSVEHVNYNRWNNVQMVSDTTGYRLPTEAQWEYACRAGTKTVYSFGNDPAQIGDYAWYIGNSELKTHEAGIKLPNLWNLYDMYGNVWEWCWDWYGITNYILTQTDPEGPSIIPEILNRVQRGSCWENSNINIRSALRSSADPCSSSNNIGFRVIHY
ncbi:MAG: formylglycine-generating enzyme family protein [Treponema sp.]|nr:formylglycine-generating enzyme family protein [Treponema sp.]